MAPEPTPLPVRESARSILNAWLHERLAREDVVDMPAVAREATYQEFADDKEFLREWFKETVYSSIYDAVQRRVALTRKGRIIGSVMVPLKEGEQRKVALRQPKRYLDMFAHSGDQMIRLRQMTRVDLRRSAEEDRARGEQAVAMATFKLELARLLTDDETVVGDAMTEEEIAVIASGIDVGDRVAAITEGR